MNSELEKELAFNNIMYNRKTSTINLSFIIELLNEYDYNKNSKEDIIILIQYIKEELMKLKVQEQNTIDYMQELIEYKE